MNKVIVKSLYLLYLVLTILIVSFVIKGRLTFGVGLGDLFYLVLIIISDIFIIGYYFIRHKKPKWEKYIIIIFTLFLFFMLLNLTIWRGLEYPWNGKFFIAEQISL